MQSSEGAVTASSPYANWNSNETGSAWQNIGWSRKPGHPAALL